MKRLMLVPLAILFLCTTGRVNAGPINPVVEYTSSSTISDSRAFTTGYKFTTSTTYDVNALGYFADGLGHSHQVGIWDSTGTLLTSTTVVNTDSVVGHFQYHMITDIFLAPGTYTIGGTYRGENDPIPFDAMGVVSDPGYTWVTDEQQAGSGLNYPTVTTGGSYGQNGLFNVDFSINSSPSVIPEPASVTLLGLGALSLFGYGWKRRRSA